MKLLELGLERYGAFTDRSITLAPDKGLAVIFGANEMGKSTLLSGVTDFLFGIPPHSPHGELFGYDAMRVRARLELNDQTEISLKRRKGRTKTLMDDKGAGFDQAVLGRALGATSRERFLELFGLNHATLRAGGDGLLTADGELGRLIVEAGGGLRGMVQRLGQLDAYLDGLFAPRRSDRRAFYQALNKIETADRLAKAAATSKDAYEEAKRGYADAYVQYQERIEEGRALAKRASEIERLVRVQPLLARLALAEADLAGYAELQAIPVDFHEALHTADAGFVAAAAEADRAEAQQKRIELRHAELAPEADWRAHRDEIIALAERAIEVRKARASLSNRRRDLGTIDTKLATLRTLLRLPPDADLAARAPEDATLEQVRRLHTDAVERRAAVKALTTTIGELDADLSALAKTIEIARALGHDKPFGLDAAELAGLPQAHSNCAVQGKRLAKAAESLDAEVKALGFRGLDHLKATQFPDLASLRAELEKRLDIARNIELETAQAEQAQSAAQTAAAAAARLEKGAALASPEAIAAARRLREEALQPLVRAYRKGLVEAPEAQREREIASVTATNRAADDLADRRTDDAKRVAELGQHRAREDEANTGLGQARAAIARLETQRQTREQTFAQAYPDAIAFESDLSKLLTIVIERSRLLELAANLEVNLADADARMSELEPKRQALALAEQLLPRDAAKPTALVERVKSATAAIKAHDTGHSNFVRDARDLAAKEARRSELATALDGHAASDRVWRKAWLKALTALGLATEIELNEAEIVLREWALARGELASAAQTQLRITQIEADIAELSQDVAACASALDCKVSADPVEAAAELKRVLEQQEQQWAALNELKPELDRACAAAATAREACAEAARSISAIGAQANLAPDADRATLISRLRARDVALSAQRHLEEQVLSAGDELPIADLRSACALHDIDSLRADQSALETERQRNNDAVKAAIEAMTSLEAALKSFEDPSAFNQAIADRECAASDMHLVAERWLETVLARDLLTEAIARVRAQQQDPLIARAGALFALTTKGAYQGIDADVDEDGRPVVVGLRAGGGAVGVGKMSDGVRDQLYLAFRLASIEAYGKEAEPIPFIADDILVHFDDERTAATLELLAEFGKTNQVLLFTHHQSVRDAAVTLNRADDIQIVELAPYMDVNLQAA